MSIARNAPFTCSPMPGSRGARSSPIGRRRSGSGSARARGSRAGTRSSPRRGEAEQEPVACSTARVLVDPVDHHEPDRRERGAIGNRYGSAFGSATRMKMCGADAAAEEVAAVGQARVGGLVGALGEDRREPGGDEQRDRDQREEARDCGRSLPGSGPPFPLSGAVLGLPPPPSSTGSTGTRARDRRACPRRPRASAARGRSPRRGGPRGDSTWVGDASLRARCPVAARTAGRDRGRRGRGRRCPTK